MKPTLLLLALALAFTAHAADDKKAVDPAVAAATQKVNATGASLMPLSADAKAYRFTALNVAKEFGDAGLEPLAPIADKIASLDIARSKVTDGGLKALAAMKNLKELHLEGTGIGDAGLDHLKGLAELEYINLYNTKVTDAGVAKLAGLGKLKAIYLWQSGVTKVGVVALKAKLPNAHINTGWTAEDDAKPVAVAATAPAAAAPAAAKPAAAPAPAAAKPAAPAAAPAAGGKLNAAIADKAIVYRDVIAPIMQAKCVGCHGEEKKKGKLQLHTFAAIMKGGGDGANTVIAKNTKESLMLVRASLPTDDDEHMPPSDEPQLTKEEVALLKWWIETGASETASVAASKPTADVEGALAVLLAKGLPKAAAPAKVAKPKPAALTDAQKKQIAEITAKMQALNASLMPLAQDTEQLRLGVINAADKFGDKELALLDPIAAQIVWVDLARSQITDAAADTLAKMTNLERLHMENTKVSDAALAKLAALQNLEYLNLYGTKTTDGGIAKLAAAKGLKKLFVWQTGVTQNGAKALEAQLPGLKVNVGLTEAEIAKLTAPPPAPPAPPPAPAKKEEPKKVEAKKADAKPAVPAPAKPATTPPATKPAAAPAATPPATKPAPAPAVKPAAATPPAPAKPAEPAKK
ncbi:c-type cytochrome domain-containing protein [Prosthecobacter sp.]|uniref:c-type cytochrome domain-containing protein n=1 Tax=Prosthecobacter sp. TaxID=1965333 RepID=UPI002AB9C590|nr:c-type cytochrome domain-containing protein [Prosthecobacter sp.]MDZ4404920.1 c-type cytochrome domain-containing protein [Prosthecobacter sp.]